MAVMALTWARASSTSYRSLESSICVPGNRRIAWEMAVSPKRGPGQKKEPSETCGAEKLGSDLMAEGES